jgi:predicted RNA-binding protein YlxR (DUF448 family)
MSSVVERRCVVTRERGDRKSLVRLVRAPDGQVFCDYRGKLAGRGAWVTPSSEVLSKLEKAPGILRRPLQGNCKTGGLLEQVRAANWKAVRGTLGLAAKAGLIVGGKDGVRAALASQNAQVLLLAQDASPRLVKDLRIRAGDRLVVELPLTTETLGAQIGKGPRAALVVTSGRPARALLDELHRLHSLR